jgi:5-oxoprolinase (ATP-hydrolysing)
LENLRDRGIEAIAVSFLHAWKHPQHEQFVAQIAKEVGFKEVCTSHETAPTPRLVPRTETTVLDAFLTPVLRSYLDSLTQTVGSTHVRLMTSAGMLVKATDFRGSDSVLSGPAGGVIGFARAAEAAGFSKAIGLDMGGTSTDVAHYAGQFMHEFDGLKAGVKLIGDRLAIETVAAGGGSICDVVGRQLVVGPKSAGATPGPACYGQGGPLTITDCNVRLGRIDADRFPFPLDHEAIERRLNEAFHTFQKSVGSASSGLRAITSAEELAAGFIEIANATMARAIRKISIQKGLVPEDYLLVAFGGAAAQHACGIARLLDIPRILIHPLAALLCAYGLSQADLVKRGEKSIYRLLDANGNTSNDRGSAKAAESITLQELAGIVSSLSNELSEQIEQERCADQIPGTPRFDIALRYFGSESVLDVPWNSSLEHDLAEELARQFRQLHQLRYGYDRANALLEIVAVRGELSAVHKRPQAAQVTAPSSPTQQTVKADKTSRQWLNNEWGVAPRYRRDQLSVGDTISGPALISDPTTTTVVDADFTAQLLPGGELLLTRKKGTTCVDPYAEEPHSSNDPTKTLLSPVEIEVFHQRLASIADEMGIKLQQTAQSTNVKERLDYSCAIFSRAGELVVNAPHVPVHLGAMSESIKSILAAYPQMEPGDVFLTNDPFSGGSHLPDLTVVSPVFIEDNDPGRSPRLCAFVANRAHHAEIGGIVPGSMPPFSKRLADEGILLKNLRIVHHGLFDEAGLRAKFTAPPHPSRMPDQNIADLIAQMASNTRGAELVAAFVREQSPTRFEACLDQLKQIAATMIRHMLSTFPESEHSFVDHLDDGSPIRVTSRIVHEPATSEGPPLIRCQLDFTGTAPVLATNLNANRAIVTACVMYVLRSLLEWHNPDHSHTHFPLNSGVLDPIDLLLPECLLNPPAYADPLQSAAVVGGNVETSQRVVDVLLGLFGVAAASQGTMNNLTFGNKRFGYYETICGGVGATSRGPGADAVHSHMTNTRLTDPEILEQRYPLRVRRFEIREGSGGEGQHRGGHGVSREIEFLETLSLSILSERRGSYRPYGVAGGGAGATGQNLLTKAATGEVIDLGGKASIHVQPGDIVTIHTPGGGGWGAV